MKKYIFYLLFFIISILKIDAQIYPPDLICITSGDTLFWNLPNNSCGTFNSYQIFGSSNQTGPYTMIVEITNQTQTSFFNTNPEDNLMYYYMQSNYNCAGEPVLSSDTLDNRSPEKITIESVSVSGTEVDITWEQSSSPEVTAYIIYRQTNIGLIPIDTVAGTNYTDVTANPENTVEYYDVLALDPCGNTSLFNDNLSNTMNLTSSLDSCVRKILLSWNTYNFWSAGIGAHEIWVSTNGNTPELVETISGDVSTYDFEDLNDGDTYCITVKAIQNGTTIGANSNEICETANIIQPMRDIAISNVSVFPNNTVEVSWVWDTTAEIHTYSIESILAGNDIVKSDDHSAIYPLSYENVQIDVSGEAGKGQVTYWISTIDNCGASTTSAPGKTIFLSGASLPNQTNSLTWTPFDIENASVIKYEIYKLTTTGEEKIDETDEFTTQYSDPIGTENLGELNPCYYIKATFKIDLPNDITKTLEATSNIACVEQVPTIYTPNAFAPRGINQEFKPVVLFGETSDYQMLIYDRWGQKIYESNSIDKGWDGKVNGKNLEQGVYVYYIKLTQKSGNVVEDKGTVFLLR